MTWFWQVFVCTNERKHDEYFSDGSEGQKVAFDFLVDGEFLQVSLQEHMDLHSISTVSIDYRSRLPAQYGTKLCYAV